MPTKMDPVNIKKYQAMEKCNYYKNFISSLIQCSLLVAMLGLFLSNPLWLPTLYTSTKIFFMQSLPKIAATVLRPKSLFIVFNLIIIILVGESRLTSPSPNRDIYEEYVAHVQSLKGVSRSEGKGNEGALASSLVEVKKEREKEKEEEKGEDEGESEDLDEEEEREAGGLSDEELNKRVEDFIARVNLQRRLEEKMLACWEEETELDFRSEW